MPSPPDSTLTLPMPFGWFGIMASAALPAGSRLDLHYFARDLILSRDADGKLRLINAAEEGAPFLYPVIEANQVIWAWYHPARLPPTYGVEERPEFSDPQWQDAEEHGWIVHASMQETAENSVDTAHFKYVHGMETVPPGEFTTDGVTRRTYVVRERPPRAGEGDRPVRAILDNVNIGPGMSFTRLSGVIDTLVLGYSAPISAEKQHLRVRVTQKIYPEDSPLHLAARANLANFVHQIEQDIPIWNHKRYLPRPLLCDGDGPIMQFRRFFSRFYYTPELSGSG